MEMSTMFSYVNNSISSQIFSLYFSFWYEDIFVIELPMMLLVTLSTYFDKSSSSPSD